MSHRPTQNREMATTTDDERREAILAFAEFDREEHRQIYDDLADE